MFGSASLEVAIGLLVIYLMLALTCSAVTEQIGQYLGLRANHLWESICSLLADRDGSGMAADLYDHHLIRGLCVAQGSPKEPEDGHPADRPMPSSIPSDVFAVALDDLWKVRKSRAGKSDDPALAGLRTALDPLYKTARKKGEDPLRSIAAWYESAMDRCIGWYKRKIQLTLFIVSLIVVTATNSDTIMIAGLLYQSPDLRAQVSSSAREIADSAQVPAKVDSFSFQSGLLGWTSVRPVEASTLAERMRAVPRDVQTWLLKIFGLLVTAYLATLGAPFWFDLIKKLAALKSAGPASLLRLSAATEPQSGGSSSEKQPAEAGGRR